MNLPCNKKYCCPLNKIWFQTKKIKFPWSFISNSTVQIYILWTLTLLLVVCWSCSCKNSPFFCHYKYFYMSSIKDTYHTGFYIIIIYRFKQIIQENLFLKYYLTSEGTVSQIVSMLKKLFSNYKYTLCTDSFVYSCM